MKGIVFRLAGTHASNSVLITAPGPAGPSVVTGVPLAVEMGVLDLVLARAHREPVLHVALKPGVLPTVRTTVTRTVLVGAVVLSVASSLRDLVRPTVVSTAWERLVLPCVPMRVPLSAPLVLIPADSSVVPVVLCVLLVAPLSVILRVLTGVRVTVNSTV